MEGTLTGAATWKAASVSGRAIWSTGTRSNTGFGSEWGVGMISRAAGAKAVFKLSSEVEWPEKYCVTKSRIIKDTVPAETAGAINAFGLVLLV